MPACRRREDALEVPVCRVREEPPGGVLAPLAAPGLRDISGPNLAASRQSGIPLRPVGCARYRAFDPGCGTVGETRLRESERVPPKGKTWASLLERAVDSSDGLSVAHYRILLRVVRSGM
jgi:hypothetical protein